MADITVTKPRTARKAYPVEIGMRFGKLTVADLVNWRVKRGVPCICECGKTTWPLARALYVGEAKSCGDPKCRPPMGDAQKAHYSAIYTTHGMRKTSEYRAWHSMRARCLCSTHQAYARYGGRGLKIDPSWDSFETFFADMGPKPSPQHTLERVDNNQGYGPNNCEWAVWKAQNRNRRNTRMVDWDGRILPLVEACEIAGLDYPKTWSRIHRLGWSVQRALGSRKPTQ
jgi:hypothetical protein